MAFVALLAFRSCLPLAERNIHVDTLTTALVDFHKSQCYYASTIQITALVLASRSQASLTKWYDSQSQSFSLQGMFNGSFLVALAVTGFLPVPVTLACIGRHGRLSWYLITLSAITMALATITLAWSWRLGGPSRYILQYWFPRTSNGYTDVNVKFGSILNICGSQEIMGDYYDIVAKVSSAVWVVWAYCVLWLLLCLFQKLH